MPPLITERGKVVGDITRKAEKSNYEGDSELVSKGTSGFNPSFIETEKIRVGGIDQARQNEVSEVWIKR